MQFMMMVEVDRGYEAGVRREPELLAAIRELIDEMVKAGVLRQAVGVVPSANCGARA